MTRDFRLLVAGQALSWLGNGFQQVALATAVVLEGGGASELGLVMASGVLALLVGSLFGGVWADRLQPRTVMAVSDLVRIGTVSGMAVMFGTDHRSTPVLCVLAALSSAAGSFFGPAMTSLKPLVLPPAARQQGNARMSLVQTTCSVLGPAAGGLVVAAFGATTGFVVNASSYAASVVSVLLLRTRAERARNDSGVFHDMRRGWATIRERGWLLAGVLAATVYHVANGVVIVLAPVVAIRELGGPDAAGLVSASEGLGGVLGAAVALRARPVRLLRAGWLALPLMTLWVLAFVWPGKLPAVMAGAVLGYAGLIFFDVCWETALQDQVPHELLARVASWDTLTSFLGMPLGSLVAGPLSSAFGTDRVLLGCAAVLLLASLSPLLARGTRELTRLSPQPV